MANHVALLIIVLKFYAIFCLYKFYIGEFYMTDLKKYISAS